MIGAVGYRWGVDILAERTGSNAGFVAADENVALRAGVAGSGVVVGTGQTSALTGAVVGHALTVDEG